MNNKMVSHDEVMRLARQDPDFVKEERKIKPFFELAKAIYRKRKEKNLSQKQLAKISNTYQTRISKLENGDLNPNLSTIIDIVEALGCELSISLKECPDDRETALKNNNFFYLPGVSDNDEETNPTESTKIEISPRGDYVKI